MRGRRALDHAARFDACGPARRWSTWCASFFGNDIVARQFRRAGYFRFRQDADPLFVTSRNTAEAPRRSEWYIADFDNDNR